jgi:hypothetical protein
MFYRIEKIKWISHAVYSSSNTNKRREVLDELTVSKCRVEFVI